MRLSRLQRYSLHLQRGEWTLAQQYLNELGTEAKNGDFVAVQEINLARLQSTAGPFEPTTQQWGILESVAVTNKAAANHAKALLSLLRGDHFPAQLPMVVQALEMAPTVPSVSNSSINPTVYPNPANTNLKLHHLPYSEETGTVKLLDQLGRTTLEVPFRQTNQIQLDVSGLTQGVYFVQIMDGKSSTHTLRVMIAR